MLPLVAARQWLDHLDVDPFFLDSRGLNGRLHLLELIEAYAALQALSPGDQSIRGRATIVAIPTGDERWALTDENLRLGLVQRALQRRLYGLRWRLHRCALQSRALRKL